MKTRFQMPGLSLAVGLAFAGWAASGAQPNAATPAPTGMVLIPAGSFTMGDTFGEGDASERPTHTVNVSSFYMDTHLVSQAQWATVYHWATNHGYTFRNPGSYYSGALHSQGTNHPVHTVNWHDMVQWCNARSEKEGRAPAYYTEAGQTNVYRTGQSNIQNSWVKWNGGYRLPTEAEWEKAARGGLSGKRFPWGDTISHSQANYSSDASVAYDTSPTRGFHPTYKGGTEPGTSPVGAFAPNGYGLFDMAGNVWQCCWDWYDASYYSPSPGADPRGSATGPYRVVRGGDRRGHATDCRSAGRSYNWPDYRGSVIGFRVVLAPGQP